MHADVSEANFILPGGVLEGVGVVSLNFLTTRLGGF